MGACTCESTEIRGFGFDLPSGLSNAYGEEFEEQVPKNLLPALSSLCRKMQNSIFKSLIGASTKEEFSDVRRSHFGDYVKLSISMGGLLSSAIDPTLIESLNALGFDRAQELIRERGDVLPWLEGGAEEAEFCVSTLQRAYSLLPDVLECQVSYELEGTDRNLASEFSRSALWAQMHLDTLMASLKNVWMPNETVLNEILVGMRSAVDAYAAVREAVDLRYSFEPCSSAHMGCDHTPSGDF